MRCRNFRENNVDELALQLRQLIYESALRDCVIPTKDELSVLVKRRGADVARALGELHDAHQIVLQADGGEVLMAPPFSAVPTSFEVTAGERTWFANCIWDAMGVAAQIGEPVTIATSCGCCGDALGLNVPNPWLDSDSRVVHFALPAARWWDDIVFN
jgi:hypothetical protein